MRNSGPPTEYLQRLLRIARDSRVRVYFIEDDTSLDWDGLYLVDRELGSGIAIREGLEPDWRDWVLGHELGHHFGQLRGMLFSPFYAHTVDTAAKERWTGSSRLDPDEEAANRWAINALVSRDEWEGAEQYAPCHLRTVTSRLGLPLAAAIAWERQERECVIAHDVEVQLSAEARAVLDRPISGKGGHQSFFRTLDEGRNGARLTVNYRQFSFARERAATVRGGWLARYHTLLESVRPHVSGHGGVRKLFKLRTLKSIA
jgi:hypothetical protein